MDTHTTIVLGAFLVAMIAAGFKLQFQALFYLLVCIYVVTDFLTFGIATLLFIVGGIVANAIRAAAQSG